MNPNHGGLMKSIYQQELVMLTNYLSTVLRTDKIEVLTYYPSIGSFDVHYVIDGEQGTWNYPADMNTFVHEQLVRLITAEYSDLDY